MIRRPERRSPGRCKSLSLQILRMGCAHLAHKLLPNLSSLESLPSGVPVPADPKARESLPSGVPVPTDPKAGVSQSSSEISTQPLKFSFATAVKEKGDTWKEDNGTTLKAFSQALKTQPKIAKGKDPVGPVEEDLLSNSTHSDDSFVSYTSSHSVEVSGDENYELSDQEEVHINELPLKKLDAKDMLQGGLYGQKVLRGD